MARVDVTITGDARGLIQGLDHALVATLSPTQRRYLAALRSDTERQWLYADQIARRVNGHQPRTLNGPLRVLDRLVELDLVDYIDITADRHRAFRKFRAAEVAA